jgi:ABC-2 type transport system ATP-binding protein
MKMELIGAILHWPKVIFLDEPTIGLDVLAAHNLREFLRVFNQREKATIILTSHNMDDIERLCSRVLILRDGSLIYDGDPHGLTGHNVRRLRVRFMGTPDKDQLSQLTGVAENSIETEREETGAGVTARFVTTTERIVPLLQVLMGKFQIAEMGIEEQSLENVIHRLYEGGRVQA